MFLFILNSVILVFGGFSLGILVKAEYLQKYIGTKHFCNIISQQISHCVVGNVLFHVKTYSTDVENIVFF